MLEKILASFTPRPLPTPSRNTDEVGQYLDQVLGGVAVEVVGVVQDTRGIEVMDLANHISDNGARRKGLRIPAPKFSGRAETYTAWRPSILSYYAEFNALLGRLTGQLRIDLSRNMTER